MSDEEKKRGILKTIRSGAGFLRDVEDPIRQRDSDVYVSNNLIDRYNLEEGTTVSGPVKRNDKGLRLSDVETICGVDPNTYRNHDTFKNLTALMPEEKFDLTSTGEISMRVIDLLAPLGKGTRCLVVSPPRAGKTTILEQLCRAIGADAPETKNIVLLVDERPEEVTQFRRNVDADVIASSNDQSPQDHVELTRLVMNNVRRRLECGQDVVVLVDSLTRMARAFNLAGVNQTGKTLSGGVDAGAVEVPRKFFGLARNVENGGSITVIATALVDTGSQMDEVFFEEFKGTGNSEIVLDRDLADAHIYPAIDVAETATRKDERLHSPKTHEKVKNLQRWLINQNPKEAMQTLVEFLEDHPTREEVLNRLSEL